VKNSALDDDYILEFLMQSHSLNELLDILGNICQNLDLTYLNTDHRHYRHFSLTVFGLIARAESLLSKMLLRSEILRHHLPQFNEVHLSLLEVDKKIGQAHKLIVDRRMRKGKDMIMEVAHEYSTVFLKIKEILISQGEPNQ